MKKLVEDIAVIPLMSQPVMEDEKISEEQIESQPVLMTMFEKLTKAVNNLGSEVSKEKSFNFQRLI